MLFRKMLRDLKQNKTQFLSIFLMAFLSIFVYAGVGGEWRGMEATMNDYYEETNFADLWLYGTAFTEEEEHKIADLEEVSGVQRRLSVEASSDLDGEPILTIHIPETYQISKNLVSDGQSYDISKDGIWLDLLFAEEHDLKPGDSITFSIMGMEFEKEVIGLIHNPEYIFDYTSGEVIPDHKNYGFAYMNPVAIPDTITLPYTTMLITLTEDASADSLETAVDEALDGHYSVYLERENQPSHAMFQSEIEQHAVMADVFPVVFLAIAMLTILTTMTRIINNQRTQIGTLKALGYKRRKIVRHYVSYGFFTALAGSLLGAIIGPLTLLHLFFGAMQTTFHLPQWISVFDPVFIMIAAAAALISAFFTWLACRNNLKETPSQTLRPKAPKVNKRNVFERSSLWE